MTSSIRVWAFAGLLLVACSLQVFAQDSVPEEDFTPLRLSYVEGDVSFWRPGEVDWVAARVNTPLEAGDGLYTAKASDVELQLGGRAFVRADENTQLSLVDQSTGFLQFRVTGGRVSLDLRELPGDYTLEVDTPDAAFTIQSPGYYRLDVGDETHFTTRRGGVTTVIPAGGKARRILPSEEVVVRDGGQALVTTYVAPEPDAWDRWNYARTDDLIDALSARYLPPGVAGANDLDQYGNWRVVPEYGPVWVPEGVPPDWVPYSTGSWIWDPNYEWTWVDDAPWGWAPYHYGRWVHVNGVWAWAPGPVIAHRPHYAPALVAFFGIGSGATVRLGLGGPGVGWVALSWGEPLVPWWGRPGFRGRPTWRGWHGPRETARFAFRPGPSPEWRHFIYRNTGVPHAVVAEPDRRFGREHGHVAHFRLNRMEGLEPVHGQLPVRPDAERLVGGARKGVQPPRTLVNRPVVTTRPPHEISRPWRSEPVAPAARPAIPAYRHVAPPRRPWAELPRPEFGSQGGRERERPPLPSRFGEIRHAPAPGHTPAAPQTPRNATRRPEPQRPAVAPERPVPGRPAVRKPAPRIRRVPQTPVPRKGRPIVRQPERREIHERKEITTRNPPPAVQRQMQTPGREMHERRRLPGRPANELYRRQERNTGQGGR